MRLGCNGRRRPPARAALHVLARGFRCRHPGTVSPQSTALSCPLCVLTHHLDTGIVIYRASGGCAIRPPVPRERRPRCRRRRREDLCGQPQGRSLRHATNRLRCDDARHVRTFLRVCVRRKVEGSTYERDEFSGHRPLGQLFQLIKLRQGACPPESCRVAEWMSCGLQGQHAFHSKCSCCLNQSTTEDPRGFFLGFLMSNSAFFKLGCFVAKNEKSSKNVKLCFVPFVRCCLCVVEVGAPRAE